jgi:DNA-3-methyladenine glycosylase I
MASTLVGMDGRARCRWCAAAPEFLGYHDAEWGFPIGDDRRLFETLTLESFQSGLSWRTILVKREHFRAAFRDFEVDRVARFSQRDVERLLKNPGIVRHRGKIAATINNARRLRELAKRERSFGAYLWRYEHHPQQGSGAVRATICAESLALSKDLKRRGWAFVGPTTIHAFMQAVGLINGHVPGCVIRSRVESARRRFTAPQ